MTIDDASEESDVSSGGGARVHIPGTMKMLTILKASYSDEVFRKALAEVGNEAIEDDIEVVIQEPKMWKESWTKKIGLHRIAQLERLFGVEVGRVVAFQIFDFVFYNPFAGQF